MVEHATPEHRRLAEHDARRTDWKEWGPYLSERAWGTVREDYSADGSAWEYLPHDHARSRAYRWNEDGLGGVSDRHQHVCMAVALWNGRDPILKERLFGLAGPEGNHGEDVKEVYAYLDATPTHSYLHMRYRYPHARFPYEDLVAENMARSAHDPEYEILDTGVFDEGRFFDVDIVWAKAAQRDLLCVVTVTNRGVGEAECWVLPTVWFRNTWSWGYLAGPMGDVPVRPEMRSDGDGVVLDHPVAGTYRWYAAAADEVVFTGNETNTRRLFGVDGPTAFTKDAFHRYLVDGDADAVDPDRSGTKAASIHRLVVGPGESATVRIRMAADPLDAPFDGFDEIVCARRAEAGDFYSSVHPDGLDAQLRSVQRQALAGMIWSKQLYYFDVDQWLRGDPAGPAPPPDRVGGRNRGWAHLNAFDILSMPDAWEYPWFAAWDLAFHAVPLALVDPGFAKRQLELMTREWFMHPNGQIPAYEWAFGDVNPPVHAWGAWTVYRTERDATGVGDRRFLEGVFHKLLLNFTWWVNRKDEDGNNVFQGGFLGLDNVSVFDRSAALPTGGHLDQSDGTAWMGFYSLGMLQIALELARENPVYQDVATKFFEHFLAIAAALTDVAGGHCLWSEADGFFYDVVHLPGGTSRRLEVRSLVGLIPLLAVTVLGGEEFDTMDDFTRRMRWFTSNRPELAGNIASVEEIGAAGRHLLSFLTRDRLRSLLGYLLDENEFLSPYGIRSLSRAHAGAPFRFSHGGDSFEIGYEPAESTSGLFGGNSNWRGPVWMPINFLIIEALRTFHDYHGDTFVVEFPTGSGRNHTLAAVADHLTDRLVALFIPDTAGDRPIHGRDRRFRTDPLWTDVVLFHEYFHGDTGAGLGASHQTGWTGLVANLIARRGAPPT